MQAGYEVDNGFKIENLLRYLRCMTHKDPRWHWQRDADYWRDEGNTSVLNIPTSTTKQMLDQS